MARHVRRERRRRDVGEPGRVDEGTNRRHRPERPVGVLRVPAGDERVCLPGVQGGEEASRAFEIPARAVDRVDRDLVPVARRRHRPGPVRPEVGDPLLLGRQRARHVVHLAYLREIGGAAVGGRRRGTVLRAVRDVPRLPRAGERLEGRGERGRRRNQHPLADGRGARPRGGGAVGLGAAIRRRATWFPAEIAIDATGPARRAARRGAPRCGRPLREEVRHDRRGRGRDGGALNRPARLDGLVHALTDERERACGSRWIRPVLAIASSSNSIHAVTAPDSGAGSRRSDQEQTGERDEPGTHHRSRSSPVAQLRARFRMTPRRSRAIGGASF